ncbi:DNA-binding response regulator, NarL/FixJ family, contains REC and HTH domains [Goodfellowiella coeruleoviolacea]|uniref:DNA-binding response regulator, NarL/FixJ family, contains REC and HTH domains n=2 Tax=Goodfellowiella coeruleoviolacea TaxID=334858 RepID=A0AAE3GFN5_9PSEU|nr:DNA-binding response regulator, NarL/FixJ family, contains REC and HTH domains [Goodfellowiella coeruleoviolacea]
MNLVTVLVRAVDPLTRMAISSHLNSRPNIQVVPDERHTRVDVAVVVADRMTVEVVSALRKMKAAVGVPVVLIAGEISRTELLTIVECNVVAVLPRASATADRIENAVRTAASGGGVLPSTMLGDLLKQVEQVHREVLSPHGLHTSGLTPREIDVLRLMSDGLNTSEIAMKLCFSERAVKRVISGMTTRLKLRNRPHAVAYALRKGVI